MNTSQNPASFSAPNQNLTSTANDGEPYPPPNMNAKEAATWERMSPSTRRAFIDTDLRVCSPSRANILWNDVFTPDERRRLGDDLQTAWERHHTLGMWMLVKSYSNRFLALVKLGVELEALSQLHAKSMLRAAGLKHTRSRRTSPKIDWDRDLGRLTFDGQTIRNIKVFKIPSNVERILNAFQQAGWPSSVLNPLDDPLDPEKLHQAIKELNKYKKYVRFSARGGASFVVWTILDDTPKSQSSHSQLK